MLNEYTAHLRRKRRSPNTIRLRLFYLRKFHQWYQGDLLHAQHDDFIAYLDAHPHWSSSTHHTATASIRAFYTWATREGVFAVNPARDMPAVIVHRKRQRTASEESIETAVKCDDPSDRAMVLLGAECGLRVTEIATLHDRNVEGDWLRIVGKGNRQRYLSLSPELKTLLEEIRATRMRHGWFFPGRSGVRPIHSSTAWRHISAVLASNPHSLRRRAGTVVYYQSGHDIRLAQVFLGHQTSATTEVYLDIVDDSLMKAAALTRVAA